MNDNQLLNKMNVDIATAVNYKLAQLSHVITEKTAAANLQAAIGHALGGAGRGILEGGILGSGVGGSIGAGLGGLRGAISSYKASDGPIAQKLKAALSGGSKSALSGGLKGARVGAGIGAGAFGTVGALSNVAADADIGGILSTALNKATTRRDELANIAKRYRRFPRVLKAKYNNLDAVKATRDAYSYLADMYTNWKNDSGLIDSIKSGFKFEVPREIAESIQNSL